MKINEIMAIVPWSWLALLDTHVGCVGLGIQFGGLIWAIHEIVTAVDSPAAPK